jgi:hypothetical protein
MRTSVTLDDDVYGLATLYANAKGITLGAAIGELVRRGETAGSVQSPPSGLKRAPNGLLVFAAREGRRPITPEMVKAHSEDEIE